MAHLYGEVPLVAKILVALALGVATGLIWGERAEVLEPAYKLVLSLLTILATPLIFLAILNALYRSRLGQSQAGLILFLLLSNTLAAIVIGIAVAQVVRPGDNANFDQSKLEKPKAKGTGTADEIPLSVARPWVFNDVMGIILLAVPVGLALRVVRSRREAAGKPGMPAADDLLDVGMQMVLVLLHWVIALVPLAVFAVVAVMVGTKGLDAFRPMLWFIIAVLLALTLQALYYLGRLLVGSWVRPGRFLVGGADALLMAFSTASSAATMPVTYACLRDKIGVREESAGLGAFVGGTFNHDGTALYEAMAALFIAQALGMPLGLWGQVVLVAMAVVASVGAAGIPEAGLVTMIAVFRAVDLPIEYIPLLLTVDWFLDRCRTAMNVMGDMCVGCLMDGYNPQSREPEAGHEAISTTSPAAAGGDGRAG